MLKGLTFFIPLSFLSQHLFNQTRIHRLIWRCRNLLNPSSELFLKTNIGSNCYPSREIFGSLAKTLPKLPKHHSKFCKRTWMNFPKTCKILGLQLCIGACYVFVEKIVLEEIKNYFKGWQHNRIILRTGLIHIASVYIAWFRQKQL